MTDRRDLGREPETPTSMLDVPGATLPLAALLGAPSCGCGTRGAGADYDEGRPRPRPATG